MFIAFKSLYLKFSFVLVGLLSLTSLEVAVADEVGQLKFPCQEKMLNDIAYRSRFLMENRTPMGSFAELPNRIEVSCDEDNIFYDQKKCKKSIKATAIVGGLTIWSPEIMGLYFGLMYLSYLPDHLENSAFKKQLDFDLWLYRVLDGVPTKKDQKRLEGYFENAGLPKEYYGDALEALRNEPGFCQESPLYGEAIKVTPKGVEFLRTNDLDLESGYAALRDRSEVTKGSIYETLVRDYSFIGDVKYNEVVSYKKFKAYLSDFLYELGMTDKAAVQNEDLQFVDR